MEELLFNFLNDNYTQELQIEIFRGFKILEDFQMADIYDDFYDILHNTNTLTNADMCDAVFNLLVKKLKFVLSEHSIEVDDEIRIDQLNEICNAFLIVQDTISYEALLSELESFDSDEEKLATIISDLCILTKEDVLTLITKFDPLILENLKKFLYNQEKETDDAIKLPVDFISNIRHFFELFPSDTIGKIIIADVKVGMPFADYLSFFSDSIVNYSDDNAAINLLSVLIFSIDGQKDPISVYRKHSFSIFNDIHRTAVIEVHLMKFLANYLDFVKAKKKSESLAK